MHRLLSSADSIIRYKVKCYVMTSRMIYCGIDASLNSIHNVQVTIIFNYSLRYRIQSFHHSNTPLELSDEIANVLLKAFKNKLSLDPFVSHSELKIPTGWSRQLAIDCEHLSYVLAIAYCNHSMFLLPIPLVRYLNVIS